MSLKDVLKWEVGSQVIFSNKVDEDIPLCCGKLPLFHGKMGQKDKNISIKIEKVRTENLRK